MNFKSIFKKLFGVEKINKRTLKYGSFATALTILFVAAVVLLNVVATMLFDRFPMALDLTEGGIYTVSEETLDYIATIEVPVEITVMSTEDEYRSISDYTIQCAELLKKYEQHNPNISVTFKDLLSNPDFVANYSQTLESGDIIVELAGSDHERVKVVSLTDILNVVQTDQYDYQSMMVAYEQQYGAAYTHSLFVQQGAIKSSNAEQAVTSALMAVTDANPITVAVVKYTGGMESDVSGLTDLLDKNGYIIKEFNIQKEEIPSDVDLLIIPAPKIDYTTTETEKLTEWLTNGGVLGKHMIYLASSEQPATPNLDSLLYKYGITVENKVVYETNTDYYSGYANYIYQFLADTASEYIEDVANVSLPVYVPNSRMISTRFDSSTDGYNANIPLVRSSASAVLRDMYSTDEDFDPESVAEKNSYNSVVLASYKALNQETHISTYNYILALGSDLIVDPVLMSASQYNNGDIILSTVNQMTGKTEGITILPKVVKSNSFDIAQSDINTLTAVFAVIIPAAVLILGIVVWVRRRHM